MMVRKTNSKPVTNPFHSLIIWMHGAIQTETHADLDSAINKATSAIDHAAHNPKATTLVRYAIVTEPSGPPGPSSMWPDMSNLIPATVHYEHHHKLAAIFRICKNGVATD